MANVGGTRARAVALARLGRNRVNETRPIQQTASSFKLPAQSTEKGTADTSQQENESVEMSEVAGHLLMAERLWMSAAKETSALAINHYATASSLARACCSLRDQGEIAVGFGFALMRLGRDEEAIEQFRFARDAANVDQDRRADLAQSFIDQVQEQLDKKKHLSPSLRKKLQQNLEKRCDEGVDVQSTSSGSAFSATLLCMICMRTEAELGRQLSAVFSQCGHKCVCNRCLRKIRKNTRKPAVECPLCRTSSKLVQHNQYDGTVFAAEQDA